MIFEEVKQRHGDPSAFHLVPTGKQPTRTNFASKQGQSQGTHGHSNLPASKNSDLYVCPRGRARLQSLQILFYLWSQLC